MKRQEVWQAALVIAAALLAMVSTRPGNGQVPEGTVASRSRPLTIDRAVELGIGSNPFEVKGRKYSLVTADQITFHRANGSPLTAKLRLTVLAWT